MSSGSPGIQWVQPGPSSILKCEQGAEKPARSREAGQEQEGDPAKHTHTHTPIHHDASLLPPPVWFSPGLLPQARYILLAHRSPSSLTSRHQYPNSIVWEVSRTIGLSQVSVALNKLFLPPASSSCSSLLEFLFLMSSPRQLFGNIIDV